MGACDVFLSHSSVDKSWVIKLKASLKRYEISSWLDKDEIRPGERFAEALEGALDECSAIVLVVSESAISSGWVKSEYYRALSLIHKQDNDVEIIPVIKNKAKMPGFLSDRNHVDFTKEDYNTNVWRLAWGIKRQKPINVIDVERESGSIQKVETENKASSVQRRSLLSLPNTKKISQELIDEVHNLIAAHGIDDDAWSQAISSQYFLAGIARRLELDDQQDYHRLLNRFLRSFHHQIDETIVLDKDHILVTPEELKKIIECMRQEDEHDPYYANSSKTNWRSIDAWKLHYNYLYGLAVEISNDDKYRVLSEIQTLAIEDLIYNQKQTALDDHGGWHPYRIPWITARILIGLKHSSIESRDDYDKIASVVNRAIDSLIRRIYDNQYWRSGVGDWVSEWESTALCIEALYEWGSIETHKKKIQAVIKYSIAHEDDWLKDPPNLTTEADSNLTLASVLMVCSILQATLATEMDTDTPVDIGRYLSYLKRVVSLVRTSAKSNSRQFCTIPQIAYYVVKTVS